MRTRQGLAIEYRAEPEKLEKPRSKRARQAEAPAALSNTGSFRISLDFLFLFAHNSARELPWH
jgi:hypothetical protein